MVSMFNTNLSVSMFNTNLSVSMFNDIFFYPYNNDKA